MSHHLAVHKYVFYINYLSYQPELNRFWKCKQEKKCNYGN